MTNNHKSGAMIGGFIGRAADVYSMNINNSFACFVVYGDTDSTATGSAAGGFSGKLEVMQGGTGTVEACYASGHLDSHFSKAGKRESLLYNLRQNYPYYSKEYLNDYLNRRYSSAFLDNQYDIYSAFECMGGFVGSTSGNTTLSKCWSTGTVWGENSSYLGGFAGKVENRVNINTVYTVGIAYGSSTYKGQFIGGVTGDVAITDAYYVDRYYYTSDNILPIANNTTGRTYNIGQEYDRYSHIYHDTNTQSNNPTHVWNENKVPKGYPFKNWIKDKEFNGEWDYWYLYKEWY